MSEEPKEKPNKLNYTQIDILEEQGKKYTGRRLNSWHDGKGICASCKYATILRQASKNGRIVRCDVLGKLVPDDITECNSYQDFTQLSLSQMAEIATLIDPRPDRYKGYL